MQPPPPAPCRLAQAFAHSIAILAGVHGGDKVEAVLGGMGPSLFTDILASVVCAQAPKMVGRAPRRETAAGLTRLLTDCGSLLSRADQVPLFQRILTVVVELLEPGLGVSKGTEAEASIAFVSRDLSDAVVRAQLARPPPSPSLTFPFLNPS
jgi:hypothetical protein